MKWFDRLVEIEAEDNYLFEDEEGNPTGVRNPHIVDADINAPEIIIRHLLQNH